MLSKLKDGDIVDKLQVGLAGKQFRQTKFGKNYINAMLKDKSGGITAVMWQVSKDLNEELIEGSLVKVSGEVKTYNGELQLDLSDISVVSESEIDGTELELMQDLPSEVKLDDLTSKLKNVIQHSLLEADRKIIEQVFKTDDIYEKYVNAPAARNNHHAYRHGLLLHSINVMEICFHSVVRTHAHPKVDMSLLMLSALLHDIGKVYELSWGAATTYTTSGQLENHSLIGADIVRKACHECGVPYSRMELIVHCIHSHHGKHEFEASVIPKTPEANILHLADLMESRMEIIRMAQEETGCNSGWSESVWALGVPLYFKDSVRG